MRWKKSLFWATAVISLLSDRLTKFWVIETFALVKPPEPPQSWPIIPGVFHFTYVTNPGAAFSWCRDCPWLPWLSLVVTIGLICLGIFAPRLPRWEQAGYGFLLGGAAGNGIDRLLTGEVIDFLDLRLIQFPVFNLADVSINVGLACLLWSAWHGHKPPASRSLPKP